MTPRELKELNQKTIKCPNSGQELIIRRLPWLEMKQANLEGILSLSNESLSSKPELESLRAKAIDDKLKVDGFRYLVTRGVVSPTIGFYEEKGETVPENHIDARWLSLDLDFIAAEIAGFSAASPEERQIVEDLAKNDPAPLVSTS